MCCALALSRCTACTPVSDGEVAACVADVAAPALALTPAAVARAAPAIERASLLVLDANIDPATLAAAARVAVNAGVPVLCEPVSVPKV